MSCATYMRLWQTSLHLEKGIHGMTAGLQLCACEVGLLVLEVDPSPGQAYLHVADVIVAAGGCLLVGLSDDGEAERLFGKVFQPDVPLVVGQHSDLAQQPLEDVRREAEKLLATRDQVPAMPSYVDLQKASALPADVNESSRPCSPSARMCLSDADATVKVMENDDSREGKHSIRCTPSGVSASWTGARGRPGVLRGAYQYEVKLESACLIRVGWSSISSKRSVGKDLRSFGYGGTAMKANGDTFEPYGQAFTGQVGAVVGCLIDRKAPENQTISFSLNGKLLGIAFQIPLELVDVPLFPALCGRGCWAAACYYRDLLFPEPGYDALHQAVAEGDAVPGPQDSLLCTGSEHIHFSVQPNQRVALHVVSGEWQGIHECRVLDVDSKGCSLQHLQDGFREKLPWSHLRGPRYHLEPLSDNLHEAKKNGLARLNELAHILRTIEPHLSDEQVEKIDKSFTSRQQALIHLISSSAAELSSPAPLLSSEGSTEDFAQSRCLQEWLDAMHLADHAAAIRAWCHNIGAASLRELTENRENLIAAITSLSSSETESILSPHATDIVDIIALFAQARDLDEILLIVAKYLDEDQVDCIDSQLTSKQKALIAGLAAGISYKVRWDIILSHSKSEKTGHLASCDRGGTVVGAGVDVTTASRISKRDQELIELARATDANQITRCGACGGQSSGRTCNETRLFYCDDCWSTWEDDLAAKFGSFRTWSCAVGAHQSPVLVASAA